MHPKKIIILLVSLLGISFMVGCSDSPVQPEDVPTVYENNVVIIDNPPLRLTQVSGSTFYFQITGTPPSISVGNVIMVKNGPVPGVFARVTSVTTHGNEMVIQTEEAKATELWKSCKVETETPINLDDEDAEIIPGASVTDNAIILADFELYNGQVPVGDLSAELRLLLSNCTVKFRNAVLKSGFTIQDSKLTEYHSIREADIDLKCNITTEASMNQIKLDMHWTLYESPPDVVVLGGIAHCISTKVQLGLLIDSIAVGTTTYTNIEGFSHVRYGTEYTSSGGWKPVRDVQMSAPPNVTTQASSIGGFALMPYIKCMVDDDILCLSIGGANIYAAPCLRFVGSFEPPPADSFCMTGWWGCDVGVSANINLLGDNPGDAGGVDLTWSPDPFLSTRKQFMHECW